MVLLVVEEVDDVTVVSGDDDNDLESTGFCLRDAGCCWLLISETLFVVADFS